MDLAPIVALGLLACRTPDGASDAPIDAPIDAPGGLQVRAATFNVRRFFDTVCESGACEGGDYEALASPAVFEARADQIARAIRGLGADVVALEEVETQACLDALLARLADVLPHGVLGEIASPGSVDVAVLSRTPLERVTGHRAAEVLTRPDGTTTLFSRELLEVEVRIEGAPVVMFAAHFRSKVNDDPGRRLAEAQAARRLVLASAAVAPAALVVLGGDLNDVPGSLPLTALTGDGGLVRVADDLPEGEQATYMYAGRGQAIDHLLLAPSAAVVRVPRSARVWREDTGYGGSDHYALTAEFRFTAE